MQSRSLGAAFFLRNRRTSVSRASPGHRGAPVPLAQVRVGGDRSADGRAVKRALDYTYEPEARTRVSGWQASVGWRRPDAAVVGRRPARAERTRPKETI